MDNKISAYTVVITAEKVSTKSTYVNEMYEFFVNLFDESLSILCP